MTSIVSASNPANAVAGYYSVQGLLSNFMQFPLPKGGNDAGAPAKATEGPADAPGKDSSPL